MGSSLYFLLIQFHIKINTLISMCWIIDNLIQS
jgi:hypothetical protein